jgi:hypothetical protein
MPDVPENGFAVNVRPQPIEGTWAPIPPKFPEPDGRVGLLAKYEVVVRAGKLGGSVRQLGVLLGNSAAYDHYAQGEKPVPSSGSSAIAKELMLGGPGSFRVEVVVVDDQGVEHTVSTVADVRAP